MAKPPSKTKSRRKPTTKPTDRRGGGSPGGKGNPPFVPTKEQRGLVTFGKACGATHEQIAEQLGISKDTLERHFRAELDQGKDRVLSQMRGVALKKALAGDNDMVKFCLARLDPEFREKKSLEHSGPDGAPMQHEHISKPADFSRLTVEKRRQLEELLSEAAAEMSDGEA